MTKEEIIGKIRRQVETWMPDNPEGDEHISGERIAFRSVLHLLDEIEQEKEPANEDLEQAANDFSESDPPLYGNRYYWDSESLFGEQLKTTFKAGAQWQREQMMKDAVECNYRKARLASGHYISDLTMADVSELNEVADRLQLSDRDKVKVIIIKE